MSKEKPTNVTVRILEHEYSVACPDSEREKLLASAEYLNKRMGAIRKTGKALGMERIAVMTALNMARELLDKDEAPRPAAQDKDIGSRLQQLQLKIDAALREEETS